ncbi:unnamed protein product [Linum tenue]|nr:unnamed protein product [Linum tenue]CAI0388334.1 unnamed protein product [Linum tenue]
MDKTFGFDTAVEEAQRAINSAYLCRSALAEQKTKERAAGVESEARAEEQGEGVVTEV